MLIVVVVGRYSSGIGDRDDGADDHHREFSDDDEEDRPRPLMGGDPGHHDFIVVGLLLSHRRRRLLHQSQPSLVLNEKNRRCSCNFNLAWDKKCSQPGTRLCLNRARAISGDTHRNALLCAVDNSLSRCLFKYIVFGCIHRQCTSASCHYYYYGAKEARKREGKKAPREKLTFVAVVVASVGRKIRRNSDVIVTVVVVNITHRVYYC